MMPNELFGRYRRLRAISATATTAQTADAAGRNLSRLVFVASGRPSGPLRSVAERRGPALETLKILKGVS